MGHAISAEIGQYGRDHAHTLSEVLKNVEIFARRSDDEYVKLVIDDELPNIAPPDAMALLTEARRDESIRPVGELDEWAILVRRLASRCTVDISPEIESQIAFRLHTHLWESIRNALKRDSADDGKGYAAMHLQFMRDVMARLDALAQPASDSTDYDVLIRALL